MTSSNVTDLTGRVVAGRDRRARVFMVKGAVGEDARPLELGTIVEVSEALAHELVFSRKARRLTPEEEAPAPAPVVPDPAEVIRVADPVPVHRDPSPARKPAKGGRG